MIPTTVKLRRPTSDDITEIESLAKRYSTNPLVDTFATAAVIEENGELTAFGVTRGILEVILYCDEHTKLLSLKKLLDQAKEDAKKLGHKSIYALIQDERFAELVIKKFGFRKIESVPVILDLEISDG